MRIAITGGIAAGKSTVAVELQKKLPDYIHVSIDGLVHEVYTELAMPPELLNDDIERIGLRYTLRSNLNTLFGSCNKTEIAAKCVQNPELLNALEEAFSPVMKHKLREYLLEANVVIEFPLLFEKDFHPYFDYIVNVEASEMVRKERALLRPGMTTEKFDFIVSRQAQERKQLSNYTFVNEKKEDLAFHTDVIAISALTKNKKVAIVSGSFDPITNGHLHLIDEGLKLMDFVVVAIAYNPNKKGMFTLEERLQLVNQSIEDWLTSTPAEGARNDYEQSIYVTIMPSNETLVGVADLLGAKYIIRGLRNTTDFEYERQIDLVQRRIAPWIETIYFMTPRELTEVSSSMVKSIHGLNGWEKIAKPYVPRTVLVAMKTRLE